MSQKINIKSAILINSMGSGGSERMVSHLLEEIVSKEYDIKLICIEKNNFYPIPQKIKVHYLMNKTLADYGKFKFFLLPFLFIRLIIYLKKNKITTLQSHIYLSNFMNILAKFFLSHQTIIVETIDINFFKNRLFATLLIKYLYKFADKFIFKAHLMAHNMEKLLQKQLDYTVSFNGYDIDRINLLSKETISDFDFIPHKRYLITVGRIENQKNHSLLIKSLSIIKDSNLHLIIIGEGSCTQNLKDLSANLNISEQVHFIGKKENPFKYISKADIFILSSDFEGFPNVLVEAMACHTSIISTDCPSGPREILAPNTDFRITLSENIEVSKYGILVPTQNKELLAMAIKYLLNDPKKLMYYKKISKERANHFRNKNIIHNYLNNLISFKSDDKNGLK